MSKITEEFIENKTTEYINMLVRPDQRLLREIINTILTSQIDIDIISTKMNRTAILSIISLIDNIIIDFNNSMSKSKTFSSENFIKDFFKEKEGFLQILNKHLKNYKELDETFGYKEIVKEADLKNDIIDFSLNNEKALSRNFFIEKLYDELNIQPELSGENEKFLDDLDNAISLFFNNNPYPFFELYNDINNEILKRDENQELLTKYEKLTATDYYQDVYLLIKKWSVVSILQKENIITKENAIKAIMSESLEMLIRYEYLVNLKLINRTHCFNLAYRLINELSENFDPKLYIEKYLTAVNSKYKNYTNFNDLFCTQFIKEAKPEKEIKLF